MKTKTMAASGLLLVLTASLLTAQGTQSPPLRDEVIKLNYIRVREAQVQSLLTPFLSREGDMKISESQNMISLRDHPQNVEKILAFIKKIDVKPADLLFSVQLVLAGLGEAPPADDSLAADPVIKELRTFLRYKTFTLLDTSLVRAMDNERSTVTLGSKETEFTLHLHPSFIRGQEGDTIKLQVSLNQRLGFVKGQEGEDRPYQKTLLESNLSIKPGEKTVVGVSKLNGGDKALILILSGKLVE